MSKEYEAVLEVDSERGVIYVHSKKTGVTLLRISRLPVPIPDPDKKALDITHGTTVVNWVGIIEPPK